MIPNGDNFICKIDVKNTSEQKLTVNLTGVISSMQYTGEVKMLIKRQKFEEVEIDAETSMSIYMSFFVYLTSYLFLSLFLSLFLDFLGA